MERMIQPAKRRTKQFAAALKRDHEAQVYDLLVSAEGALAQYLIDLATAEGVKCLPNHGLAEYLMSVGEGEPLSQDASTVVLETLKFLLECEAELVTCNAP